MKIIFDEELNPSKFRIIKFTFKPRVMQYLEFFGIIQTKYVKAEYVYIYVPLKLEFKSSKRLEEYLYHNLIIYDEVEVDGFSNKIKDEPVYYIDTSRINKDYLYTDPEDKTYSVQNLTEKLKCCRQTIYNLIKENKIKATKEKNKPTRISQKAFIDYLEWREQQKALKEQDKN